MGEPRSRARGALEKAVLVLVVAVGLPSALLVLLGIASVLLRRGRGAEPATKSSGVLVVQVPPAAPLPHPPIADPGIFIDRISSELPGYRCVVVPKGTAWPDVVAAAKFLRSTSDDSFMIFDAGDRLRELASYPTAKRPKSVNRWDDEHLLARVYPQTGYKTGKAVTETVVMCPLGQRDDCPETGNPVRF